MIDMKGGNVFADHIFKSKPPINEVFPSFNNSVEFNKHFGPVLSISTSPFQK